MTTTTGVVIAVYRRPEAVPREVGAAEAGDQRLEAEGGVER